MRFRLTTTSYHYDKGSERANRLKELGFLFEEIPDDKCVFGGKHNLRISKDNLFIEINTIEELIELSNKFGLKLVVDKDEIEIYDDYRE